MTVSSRRQRRLPGKRSCPMSTNEIESKQDVQATPAVIEPRRFRRGRVWGLAVAAVAVVGLSLSVARAQGFGGPGAFMKKRMEHVLSAANATDAQKTQIHAIWDGLRPQLKPLRQQAGDLRRQIGQAIAAPTVDTAKVETLRKQSVETMDR